MSYAYLNMINNQMAFLLMTMLDTVDCSPTVLVHLCSDKLFCWLWVKIQSATFFLLTLKHPLFCLVGPHVGVFLFHFKTRVVLLLPN